MALVTAALLDEMCRQGDPPADEVIAAHRDSGAAPLTQDVIRHVAAHMHMPAEHRSDAIEAYLSAAPPLPEWADPALMAKGAEFFAAYAAEIGTALFCASLPEGYASPRGARVLVLTGRLVAGPVRRVMETSQMLLDCMAVDGLVPGTGAGYQDARRVRLMHAAVRHHITFDEDVPHVPYFPVPWNGWCDAWGTPLNQEDLLGALLTFTITVFDVLDRLGVAYDPEALEGYLHRWCVVASIIGVRDELIPRNRAEAQAAADLIRQRQYGPSEDGRALTTALRHALEDTVDVGPLRGIVEATMRWYLGSGVSVNLGLERNAWSVVLENVVEPLSRVMQLEQRRSRRMQALSRRLSWSIIRGFLAQNRGDGRPAFAVPDEFKSTLIPGKGRFRI